jgi:hypothetical protein
MESPWTMQTVALTVPWQQFLQLNPALNSPYRQSLHDPVKEQERTTSQDHFTVAVAKQAGIPLVLQAHGGLREVPAGHGDPRLAEVLQGRRPRSKEELDAWAQDAGYVHADQRMALTLDYEAHAGVLPSEAAPEADGKQFTLGSLGLRRQTKMTAAEFERRMHEHGVPHEQRLSLAVAATQAGHIVPDETQDQARWPVDAERQRKVWDLHASLHRLYQQQGRSMGVRVPDITAAADTRPARGLTLRGTCWDWAC